MQAYYQAPQLSYGKASPSKKQIQDVSINLNETSPIYIYYVQQTACFHPKNNDR